MRFLVRIAAQTAAGVLLWFGSAALMSAAIADTQSYQAWWTITERWNAQCAGAPYVANERPFSHPVPGACQPVRPWEIWRNVTD